MFFTSLVILIITASVAAVDEEDSVILLNEINFSDEIKDLSAFVLYVLDR